LSLSPDDDNIAGSSTRTVVAGATNGKIRHYSIRRRPVPVDLFTYQTLQETLEQRRFWTQQAHCATFHHPQSTPISSVMVVKSNHQSEMIVSGSTDGMICFWSMDNGSSVGGVSSSSGGGIFDGFGFNRLVGTDTAGRRRRGSFS
jgi:WD40 repeat protein